MREWNDLPRKHEDVNKKSSFFFVGRRHGNFRCNFGREQPHFVVSGRCSFQPQPSNYHRGFDGLMDTSSSPLKQ